MTKRTILLAGAAAGAFLAVPASAQDHASAAAQPPPRGRRYA